MSISTETLLVMSNLPDEDSAKRLAEYLVSNSLAACVNIQGACQSVYRWQGKVERANEVPVFIKTTAAHYPELETAIRQLHPYDVPEIIAIPIAEGLPAYLQWLRAETEGTESTCNVC
jgi:periplasmic divalent cation tolerance protein